MRFFVALGRREILCFFERKKIKRKKKERRVEREVNMELFKGNGRHTFPKAHTLYCMHVHMQCCYFTYSALHILLRAHDLMFIFSP